LLGLVRFATLVDEVEGAGKGREYVALAKFLLDQRQGGEEYDQSHVPVTRQYEAVGHAVRAVYSYAGMAEVAGETGDVDYHSAVQSLWNSIVNRKYYVTGGVGSGETSEGFGREYSLPNNAYCESCAGSGELFFQHALNRTWQEARYADLYEETLYNAILGGVDLEGRNYTYTNPLDSGEKRYQWHVCPCCVGNLPRTLLSLPTWMYATSDDSLTVNLYAGPGRPDYRLPVEGRRGPHPAARGPQPLHRPAACARPADQRPLYLPAGGGRVDLTRGERQAGHGARRKRLCGGGPEVEGG
jgi:DUF1680 family protein